MSVGWKSVFLRVFSTHGAFTRADLGGLVCLSIVVCGGCISSSWTAMLSQKTLLANLTYCIWGYSRLISPNEWAIAEFDIPIPTSSLQDRELRTIGIGTSHTTQRNGLTVHTRRLSFSYPPTIEPLTEDLYHTATAQHMPRVVGVLLFPIWIHGWSVGTNEGLKALVICHLRDVCWRV
jgi:hypothetical protein